MDQRSSESANNPISRKAEVKCPYCQRQFHSQDELTLHIVTKHTHKGKTAGPALAGGKR